MGADERFDIKSTMDTAIKDSDAGEPEATDTPAVEKDAAEEAVSPVSDELDKDEGFKAATKELEKELGGKISFGQSKRFRDIYRKMKDHERELGELKAQPKVEEESTYELGEDELRELAQQKGYMLTKQEQKKVAQVGTELDELLGMANTPEERAWLEKYSSALEKRITDNFGKNLSPILNQVSEMIVERRLEQSEKQARKLIENINAKHGLKIDYDKDVDPELAKMLQNNKKLNPSNCDILSLTKEFLAEKGVEFGKKLSEKEARELNETKKKANIETGDTHGAGAESEFTNIKDELKRGMAREGISSFY